MMIGKIKSKYLKLLVLSLLVLFVFQSKTEAQTVSLSFINGYLGTQGSNTNQADNIKKLSTVGIARVSFSQPYASAFGGTQGNDLAGTIKIYLTAGATSSQAVNSVITLNGALNWRETSSGNTIQVFGFIFNVGQSASIVFNGSTYNIVGGSTARSSTTLGLKAYSGTFTFTDNEDRSGNAATNGLLDALNLELANSPQPSTITLTNNSVTEGQNLVYTVALSSATTANNPQVYTFSSAGTASSSVDYNSTYTFSNGVVNNGDGTITVPGGVSSFTITVATTDDATIESTETLILNIGSKSATGSILDNDAVPTLTTTGTLKTFSVCSSYQIASQSISVSGSNLTNNIVLTAPVGYEISTSASSGYTSTVTLTQSSGTVSSTSIYIKTLTSNTTSGTSTLTITSTGAANKNTTLTANSDNALGMDGGSDFVSLPANVINGVTNFTFESWVYPTSSSSWQRIFDFGKSSSTGYIFLTNSWNNNNLPRFAITTGTNTGEQTLSSSTVMPLNTWSHIAIVLNATAQTATMYLNGSQVATGSITLNPSSLGAITAAYLGKSFWPDPFLAGRIDEVRIWNTARTGTDIINNYQRELSGNESGLIANYNFNQGTPNGSNTGLTSLIDKTSNNNNGTLNTFDLSGTSSNFIAGSIPVITAAGNAISLSAGNTLQLSNVLAGGSWTSSNTNLATVSSTGLVTGVAAGNVSISYTICSKTVSYNLTVIAPTVTVTSALKNFSVCSSFGVAPQSITVSGSNLSNNIVVTAPTGYEISTTSSSGYTSTITLTQTSGTVSSTAIFIRVLTSNTTAGTSTLTITSTGVTTQNITLTANADNALDFDGADDKVTLPTSVVNGLTNFTFEAWVNPSSHSSLQRVLDCGRNGSYYMLFAVDNGKPFFAISSNGYPTIQTTATIPLNTWSHIAVVLNDVTDVVTIYINGQVAASSNSMTKNPSNIGTISSADMGNSSIYPGQLFKGKMDEVRIWSTARTASEIANNYLNELVGNETGLQAYYNMNQGVANGANSGLTTLNDRTAAARNGTLTNFALSGTSSNYVSGTIPEITAVGNATNLLVGNTLQLSNTATGGVWSSSNSNFATVSSTGLVTGVAAGTVSISYTLCSKTVTYSLSIITPTLTVSSLKTFTSCSGCVISPQTLTVSGTSLSSNVIVTAPSGFEISSAISGTYSSTISLNPISGTLTSTAVYIRLINSATTGSSGNITVSSTGALSRTVTATVNTDNALNLDGVDDYVVLDNVGNNTNLSFGGTANFTLEAWVNRKATGSTASIISKFDGGVVGNYRLYIHSNGIPYFSREASPWSVAGVSALPENEWHHIAGVFDGSTMKLYIDGVLVNSVAATGSVVSNVSIVKVFLGAANQSSISNFFKGSLDEIRIWNVARTATQIQNSYLTELAGNETGLAAYYNFNQGIANGTNTSITTLTDRGSNIITGTLTNIARTTGVTSNFVAGLIPVITGTVTTNVGTTSTLSNTLTGGAWSSTNASIASVNSSTGVVTAVAAGSATITYTICEKTVSTLFTVT